MSTHNPSPDESHPIRNAVLQIHLPLLITQLLFSSIPVASKLAFPYFSPESVVFFRITGSGVLFWILFLLLFRERLKTPGHLFYFVLYAFFGVTCNQYLFVKGVSLTTSINGSILITTIPVFTLIFALLLKKETANGVKWAGTLIAFAGAGLLIGFDRFDFTGYVKGNIMILMNSASFAFYLVISKPMLRIYRPFTVITYMYLFAGLMITPLTLGDVKGIDYAAIPMPGYLPLVIVVLFGTFLPYLINKLILQKTVSTVVAIYTYIQPLAGSLLAMVFLHEALSLRLVISAFCILAGVTLVSFHRFFALPNLFQFIPGFRPENKG